MRDDLTFGQRLRETRIRAGLSQSELEEVSGIPKARLSRYENGHVAPSIHTLARLAKALRVSEATLLGDQRAILEALFTVLYERGVRITSPEQAATVGTALADLMSALQLAEPGEQAAPNDAELKAAPALAMAPVGEWPDRDGDG
jgi:transcriptional regulator with XRE-family HTH domain